MLSSRSLLLSIVEGSKGPHMKLLIKYNFADINNALAIAHDTKDAADIMEIGQLLLLHYGIKAVETFCKEFPDKKIYVGTKLSERPEESIELFAGVGVHYLSVLAGAYHSIIKKSCEAASKKNIQIVLDFINASSLGQSAMDAETLGASAILIHRENTLNEQADNLENDWQQVRDNTKLPIFVQGKINPENIQTILTLRPQVVIIGDAITRSKNPAQEAATIKKMLDEATPPGPRL